MKGKKDCEIGIGRRIDPGRGSAAVAHTRIEGLYERVTDCPQSAPLLLIVSNLREIRGQEIVAPLLKTTFSISFSELNFEKGRCYCDFLCSLIGRIKGLELA